MRKAVSTIAERGQGDHCSDGFLMTAFFVAVIRRLLFVEKRKTGQRFFRAKKDVSGPCTSRSACFAFSVFF